MPVYDAKKFAIEFKVHVDTLTTALSCFKGDITVLKVLGEQDRKDFIKEFLNLEIDIPILTEGIEGKIFDAVIDVIDSIIDKKLKGNDGSEELGHA